MKVYDTHNLAHQWERITGISLRRFVEIMPDGEVIPDTKMLECWLKPNDDESMAECLERKYGRMAVGIIERLFATCAAPKTDSKPIPQGTQLRLAI